MKITHATMLNDKAVEKPPAPSFPMLSILLMLDSFAFGGLAALEIVCQLLTSIMDRLVSVDAQAEILNVLDHLLPYRVGYIGATILLVVITAGVYARLKSKSCMVGE